MVYIIQQCSLTNEMENTGTMGTAPQHLHNYWALEPRSSKMEGLEKLRPFVWFCQLCGFFPYRMEVDPVTKRFKRFTFSIWHPVTFWYFILALFKLGFNSLFLFNEEVRNFYYKYFARISTIQLIALTTEFFDAITIYVIVYRSSLINEAFEFLQQVDELLKSIPNRSFNVTPRIYIGLAYTLILVRTIKSIESFT